MVGDRCEGDLRKALLKTAQRQHHVLKVSNRIAGHLGCLLLNSGHPDVAPTAQR